MNDEIFDAIQTIHIAFRKVGLESPTAILLKSPGEGREFLSMFDLTDSAYPRPLKEVKMMDGSTWIEVNVLNIAVRWPATKFACPDGSFRWA